VKMQCERLLTSLLAVSQIIRFVSPWVCEPHMSCRVRV
jgi:hypothetical protein